MAASLNHPDLGQIDGVSVDGTVQFLGLKYASIEDRFAPPKLVTKLGSSPIDATKYGYAT